MATEITWAPINIAGLQLEHQVMVGGGAIKTVGDVREVAKSNSAAVEVGSITVEPRSGNEGTVYYFNHDNKFSLNSLGLPNGGLEYYQTNLPEMAAIAHEYGKPLLVNIAGFSPYQYVRLAEMVRKSGADGLTINAACPNVWTPDGKQKRIMAFDLDAMGTTLMMLEQELGIDFWSTLKLPPYSDPEFLNSVAQLIRPSRFVKAVTGINTFPNAYYLDNDDQSAISFGSGLAGLAGEALRPIGLGTVKQLKQLLPDKPIIGVGGISNGTHAREYLQVGAAAVQATTGYFNRGPKIFDDILLS
jgi:dihydroorotate dehydrogenase (fumarate)